MLENKYSIKVGDVMWSYDVTWLTCHEHLSHRMWKMLSILFLLDELISVTELVTVKDHLSVDEI